MPWPGVPSLIVPLKLADASVSPSATPLHGLVIPPTVSESFVPCAAAQYRAASTSTPRTGIGPAVGKRIASSARVTFFVGPLYTAPVRFPPSPPYAGID